MYIIVLVFAVFFFFFQAEDGIRDAQESRGLGDVYKRQMKYRATISVILITPDNVFAYGPPQHALLMDMLRQGQGVDKSRVQEPMSQLLSGSGTEAVASKDAAMMMASVAMIDALSPVIIAMHTYFRTTGAALGCT
eukprot:TRINITY_DN20277_c0_g1_i4.p1 TRINITY_DN20277_c0_g1~~TRINITY_DN20277_c0_g1_i4.p1  ORF type:complete len:136 (+),score=44.66 TRINITY_DN20277_c0_g1_i4:82-489(+)